MDLKYHIGGDGDFRSMDQAVQKINQVQSGQEAVARLNEALAQREFNRLSTLDKIVRLKQQEQQLLEQAAQQQAQGNTGAAANAALEALRRREQVERLLAQSQREREATARESAQAGER
ncbi:MAG: hypothetical protein FD161_2973, partial [Limisphaerales bacterium]